MLSEPDDEQSLPVLRDAKPRGHEYSTVDVIPEVFESQKNLLVNWGVTSVGHIRDVLNKHCTWADFLYYIKKTLPECDPPIILRSGPVANQ